MSSEFFYISESIICILYFFISWKIHKANDFIRWSESVEDIQGVIAKRVVINKLIIIKLVELRQFTYVLIIATYIFFLFTTP